MPPTSNHAYLESTGISTVLAEAVAGILRERPADPIEALAERLKAHKHKSPSSSPLDDEEARKDEKPIIEHARAVELAKELYGLTVIPGSLKDLDSYDDRNFYFRATHDRPQLADPADAHAADGGAFHFILKVHNGVESLNSGFIECQNQAMAAVRASGVWCPRALPDVDGRLISFAPSPLAGGTIREHAVRLLPFKPAGLMGGVVATADLLRQVGVATAKVSAALLAFDHPASHRTFIWDLAQTAAVRPLVTHLEPERQQLISAVLDEFESRVLPRASDLRAAVVHGDVNDQNVLVASSPGGGGDEVVGVIDFGDMCRSWLINEIAIAAAYAVIALHYETKDDEKAAAGKPKALSEVAACVAMVSSYASTMKAQGMPLIEAEWVVLPTLIACRIAMSLCIGAYSSAKDPTNEYLKLTLLPGLTALRNLRATPADELMRALRAGA